MALIDSFTDANGIGFVLFGLITLMGALGVVFGRKLMHGLIGLLAALLGIGGLYAVLYANFVLALQLIVYTGGIIVLLVFGILLAGREYLTIESKLRYLLPLVLSALIAGILIASLIGALDGDSTTIYEPGSVNTISGLSSFAFSVDGSNVFAHVFVFMFMLLLGAFLGAVKLVRKTDLEEVGSGTAVQGGA